MNIFNALTIRNARELKKLAVTPTGAYTTLTELQTTYPSGNNGIFLVGEVYYYWNGTEWVSGGTFPTILVDGGTF
jgi:hypothetical protein